MNSNKGLEIPPETPLKEKQNKKLVRYLKIASLLLACGAGVFYLAGYFLSLLVFFLVLGLFLTAIYLEKGKENFIELLRSTLKKTLAPLAGVVFAFLLGAVILLLGSYNPLTSYGALLYGGFVKNWDVTILNATPLIFTGLSIALAFKAGLFNIGAEGQYYVGALMAVFLGMYLDLPSILSIPLIFLFAGASGAAYNAIPAYLKVKTGAHEVITTMMFAYVARSLSSVFIRMMGGDSSGPHPYVTNDILLSNWLPRFKEFLPEAGYRLHTGIILAFLCASGVHYLLTRTRLGYEIRAVGLNKDAARTQGISVGATIWKALLLAGLIASFSGVNQVLGLDHKVFENLQANYGWNGISVALLASNHPIGVIAAAFLWGGLDAGGQYMSLRVGTPNSIVEIIKGVILFLLVTKYLYQNVFSRLKFGKKNKSGSELSSEVTLQEGADRV